MDLGESSKQLPGRWFGVVEWVSEWVGGESESEPRARGCRFWGCLGGMVGLGTEAEVLERGELCLDVAVWCCDEVCAREGAMGDRRPMQWSVSCSIEGFWEEVVCGVCGVEEKNKADGDVRNGMKIR